MEERILVALDGTKAGETILPKVNDLIFKATPRMDVKVTLIRVISKMNFNMLTRDDRAQLPMAKEESIALTKEAGDYLEKAAGDLRRKGIEVKTVVAFGDAAQEIVKAAREMQAHLIAMATHSRQGVVRWAIGSVTDQVMRLEGSIPVLAVKPTDKEQSTFVQPLDSLKSMVKHI